jgi:hypothetical protein
MCHWEILQRCCVPWHNNRCLRVLLMRNKGTDPKNITYKTDNEDEWIASVISRYIHFNFLFKTDITFDGMVTVVFKVQDNAAVILVKWQPKAWVEQPTVRLKTGPSFNVRPRSQNHFDDSVNAKPETWRRSFFQISWETWLQVRSMKH